MHVKLSDEYTLPGKEARLIAANVLASDALMAVLGLALAVMTSALSHGGWRYALLDMGWWEDLAGALAPHPAMVVLPALLLVVFHVGDRLLWSRSRSYREQVMRIRRGVNGELPRMNPLALLGLFCAVGFAEELLFRYGICGLILWTCEAELSFPPVAAALVAVAVSAAVFMLAHVQYQNTFGTALVFAIGLLLGAVFLWTGSLLAVAVAHWLYDFGDTMLERRLMKRDPDYFGGEPPFDAMERAIAAARKG